MQRGKRWQNANLCSKSSEEGDGAEAVGVEGVVDVVAEIGADGAGGEAEARGPLVD